MLATYSEVSSQHWIPSSNEKGLRDSRNTAWLANGTPVDSIAISYNAIDYEEHMPTNHASYIKKVNVG